MNLLFALLISFFVQTQKDFDTLQERIDAAYESGESGIDIRLDSTIFFFREKHLSFINRSMPGFAINFTGKGAVIVGESDDSRYDVGKGYVDLEALSDYDSADEVKWAYFWPIKVPFRKDIWCIPVKEPDMSEEEAEDVSIVLSQWFQGKINKVIKISNGWMYFRRDDKSGTGIYTELRYGRCLPRYILCRPPRGNDYHCCSASNFLSVRNSLMGNVSFRNIKFLGNSDGDILIRFNSSVIDSVVVDNCSFEGIRSDVLSLFDTDNLVYKNNSMTRCYRSGVTCDALSDNCRINYSRFVGVGWQMVNNCNVKVQGRGVQVCNNLFEDFTYIGIGIGTHFKSDNPGADGVICKNELYSSEKFREGAPRMLIDAGAIYCWTRNNGITICDNYIHDISGPHGNRGIFADDGSVNVTICRNLVIDVKCDYAINLRRVKRITWHAGTKIKRVNVGNKVFDNTYNGRARIYIDPRDTASFAYNNKKIKYRP